MVSGAGRPPGQVVLQLHLSGHRAGLPGWLSRNSGPAAVLQPEYGVCKRAPGGSGEEEVKAGRIVAVGTKETADKLGIHCSPFGVIPKKGKANKWRLIVDLSAQEVNDGISKELSSLSYLSVDQVVARVLILGRGMLMAKMDICQAYRNIPVHPHDQPLLGVEWKGMVYVDLALPFGLRSAPLLFTAVGDALQWIMLQQGVSWLGHYMDDFVTMGGWNARPI